MSLFRNFLCLILTVPVWASTSLKAQDNTITRSGDLLQFALPIAGYYLSTTSADNNPYDNKAMIGGLVTVSSVYALKYAFAPTPLGLRPNGGHYSFPSGHTAMAFYGARLIHKNTGWSYGIPSYTLAALTAYSRVHGNYHHVRDVAAGLALGLLIDLMVSNIKSDSFNIGCSNSLNTHFSFNNRFGISYEF